MKTWYFAVLLAVAASNSSCVRSTAGTPDARIPEVRAVMTRFFENAKRQDWDAVGELMAPEFEIYTDHAESYGKEAYVKLLKADNLLVTRMELHDDRVVVSGDGTLAWMTYKGYFENIEQGKLTKVETAETMLFRRAAGKWLISRGHASIRDLK
jgi:ketosteroid isomerase-like protein